MKVIPARLRSLQARFATVAEEVLRPHAARVDQEAQWPATSFAALADAGLMGLHVPKRLGGLEEGFSALVMATETLAQDCASSALCYGMHCVGSAVIAAKATRDQEERYLAPIAQGRHITTLALSESAHGAHAYLADTELRQDGPDYRVRGTKQFVTNGSHADSYVVSTQASEPNEQGEFSCVLVDKTATGLSWLEPWNGMGLRGNSSRGLRLDDVRVPRANRLGDEGDEVWYFFQIVAPYFLTAMAGTYNGIAQAALANALAHVRERTFSHSGESLARADMIQDKAGVLWTRVQQARLLAYHAAELADANDPDALPAILASKVGAGETAVEVATEAMALCGGAAYRENAVQARLLRDAHAAPVMAPPSALLRLWTGRLLLGLPIL
ncbi:acyl-CoA dehydrogenase [Acidiferrobacter sp. SPIII_3]|jgi:alkylation response protein AidB-like acyl-CoA dehydrogenase|uniref:acyl-CoA dehydrogenase family protein n=1 Tax=Acidiferrobacter sp. SPIII_3 TaxID=1281578 RepID=UPI000D733EB2|nr:acyl-CoA dehydrogenase family protein [Acidiferrobacter sp. SPIII_3]AWP24285.1 acyl-CoA dehydrogenase [Acidiferrobacter sp. SPIII_3]